MRCRHCEAWPDSEVPALPPPAARPSLPNAMSPVLRAGQMQQQEMAHARQAAQRVAAALGKDAAPRHQQQQGEGQQQQQQLQQAGPS